MADDTVTYTEKTPTQKMIDKVSRDAEEAGIKVNKTESGAEENKSTESGEKKEVMLDGDGNPIEPEEKPESSKSEEPEVEKEVPEPSEKKDETPSYDYSVLKDLSSEEIEKLKNSDGFKDEETKYKFISAMNDVKKWNRIAEERKEKVGTADERYKEFLEGLSKDFRGTYERFREEFGLPDSSYVEKQFKDGGLEARLAQYQDTVLTPEIEKKHKIEEGTFVYDPAEAYRAGTPSFEFRVKTERKQAEMEGEYTNTLKRFKDEVRASVEQRKADLIELKDRFFPEREVKEDMSDEDKSKIKEQNEQAEAKFTKMLGNIDEMFTKMKQGELSVKENPISLKNIFRGMHYDELVKDEVRKAEEKLHRQYKEKGLYIRDDSKPMPTDVSKVKGSPEQEDLPEYLRNKRSPLARSVSRVMKTK